MATVSRNTSNLRASSVRSTGSLISTPSSREVNREGGNKNSFNNSNTSSSNNNNNGGRGGGNGSTASVARNVDKQMTRHIEQGRGLETSRAPQQQQQQLLHETNVISGQKSARPRSAMASSSVHNQREQQQQQQQQQRDQAQQHKRYSQGSNSRVIRVRINSTHEQIEDPNWLTQWSDDWDQKEDSNRQQRKRLNHLKTIHRKLKSTLSGSIGVTAGTSGGSGSGNTSTNPNANANNSNNNSASSNSSSSPLNLLFPCNGNGSSGSSTSNNNNNNSGNSNNDNANNNVISSNTDLPPASQTSSHVPPPPSPSLPGQPVKMPVSILKQRSSSAMSGQQRYQQTQAAPTTTARNLNIAGGSSTISRGSVRLPPRRTAPISPTSSINLVLHNQTTSGRTTTSSSQQSQNEPVASGSKNLRHQASNQHQGQQQMNSRGPSPSGSVRQAGDSIGKKVSQSNVIPLCADGQVKVSGWKRNNLLAKTLSHFDEIRGNQRPVFVPTKIKLSTQSTRPTTANDSQSDRDKATKFAEIVREAISKKNLLSQSSHDDYNKTSHSSASEKSKHLNSNDEPQRSMSATPSYDRAMYQHQHQHHHQQHQHQQHSQQRSSSAGLSPHHTSSQHQQQVQAQRKETPQSPGASISLAASNVPIMSARQLKLDQKNSQFLHHLRRQSNNETQSGLEFHSQHNTTKTHGKNWKRITKKLTLLTSSGSSRTSRHQFEGQERKRSSDCGDSKRASLNSNSSNQQDSQQRSSGQQLASKQRNLLAPSDQTPTRRLSSMSMQSPNPSALTIDFDASSQTNRRSSDSDAYRRHSQSGASRIVQPQSDLRPPKDATKTGGALTVNTNDLIQLLQVTSPQQQQQQQLGNTGSCSSNNSSNSSLREEHKSLKQQIKPTADQWLSEQLTKLRTHNDGRTQNDQPETKIDFEAETEVDMSIKKRSNSMDKLVSELSEASKEKSDNSTQLCGPTSRAKIGSWMIRKSSKMAFLQQRLRNIRNWPTARFKQHQIQQQPQKHQSADPNEAQIGEGCSQPMSQSDVQAGKKGPSQLQQLASEPESFKPTRAAGGNIQEHDQDQSNNFNTSSQARSANPDKLQQPLMDPTLIGDAIELFLRAMQTTSSPEDHLIESGDDIDGDDNDQRDAQNGQPAATADNSS